MARFFGYLVLLAATVCLGQQPGFSTGAWMSNGVTWHSSTVHHNEQWARTSLLYFSANRQFSVIDCSVARAAQAIRIDDADPISLYFGDWKDLGSRIFVRYRLTYRDVPHIGISLKDRIPHQQLLVLQNHGIVFRGSRYHRENRLDLAAEATISALLPKAYRKSGAR